jgi:hypothetical protein
MAVLRADARNKLKSSSFGLPGSRKYPMPDKAHAAAKIRAKANRKLTGVGADLMNPTSNQEDINNWKSRPTTTRTKYTGDSGGDRGEKASRTEEPTRNKRGMPKFGGTETRTRVSAENGMTKMFRDH